MKSIQLISIIGVLLTLNSCQTNLDNIMSANDIGALQSMESSYFAAAEYNDSLASYIDNTGVNNSAICFYYDDMYHQNDSIFGANHMIYSHNNNGDDHQMSEWIMGSGCMNGNMIGNMGITSNSFNSSFCNINNLELMDSLMNTHDNYHPGN